ncbi:MAG: hypothetical protein OJF51_002383 [Nitrospira sp.]|jgi:hypothetical protein|nr:MAG: hypothetical protein OJF51_002383 [Nitrospira sp.]
MTEPRPLVGRFLSWHLMRIVQHHVKEIHVAKFALYRGVPYLHRVENFNNMLEEHAENR